MVKGKKVSTQTRNNWFVDAGLFLSAVVAALSGIYFLFLPVGGYQGGRNLTYGVEILFSRQTWDDLHTWGGVAMIIIAAIHIPLHWNWIVNMVKRTINELRGQCGCMNRFGRFNLWLNVVVALSFVATAISGLYFLLGPGSVQRSVATDSTLLFSRATWDLIHTWAGVVLITAAVLHFVIHWKWVVKVTRKLFSSPAGGGVGLRKADSASVASNG